MQTVFIIIHLIIILVLTGVVLIQRSEGGGLGISNGSGFMTVRGVRNVLTRLTAILATCFFLTSIVLTVLQAISQGEGEKVLEYLQKEQLTIKSEQEKLSVIQNEGDNTKSDTESSQDALY